MNRADEGEPISAGRRDRKAAEARAFANAMFLVVGFAVASAATGLLAILLIEVLRAMGLWDSALVNFTPSIAQTPSPDLAAAEAISRDCGAMAEATHPTRGSWGTITMPA